jgi:hypothetical protein
MSYVSFYHHGVILVSSHLDSYMVGKCMLAESPKGSASSIGSYGSKSWFWFMPLKTWPPSLGASAAGLWKGGFCEGAIGGGMLFEGGKFCCGKGPGPAEWSLGSSWS